MESKKVKGLKLSINGQPEQYADNRDLEEKYTGKKYTMKEYIIIGRISAEWDLFKIKLKDLFKECFPVFQEQLEKEGKK